MVLNKDVVYYYCVMPSCYFVVFRVRIGMGMFPFTYKGFLWILTKNLEVQYTV